MPPPVDAAPVLNGISRLGQTAELAVQLRKMTGTFTAAHGLCAATESC